MMRLIPAIALSLLLGVGAATAESKKSTEAKPRTAKSIECSKQADAKGLHGKERKKFRQKCNKGES